MTSENDRMDVVDSMDLVDRMDLTDTMPDRILSMPSTKSILFQPVIRRFFGNYHIMHV